MDVKTYQVIITNKLDAKQDKSQVINNLAALFKLDEQKAAQLLEKPRTVIKDKLDAETAKKYFAAIRQTGANCEIINKKIESDLPQIIEPPKPKPEIIVKTNVSHPATHMVRDTELSLVEREQKVAQETRQKLDTLKEASSETVCPQCGTIRGSVDSICLHCGFDPSALSKQSSPRTRKAIYASLTILLITLIAGFISWPMYQQYLFRQHILNELNLVFETRNQVTDFIKRTNFWPNQNIDAGLPDVISNDVIESIFIGENSIITATLRADAINENSSQTLIFTPRLIKDDIVWNCLAGSLRADLRPDACKSN